MTYRLYGAPGSGSGIIEAALCLTGAQFEIIDLDARKGEHRGEAYAAINPQRKLPCLILPEGGILTETVAILVSLDERFSKAGLLPPPGSSERPQALRWIAFMAGELYPIVELMDEPARFVQGEEAAKALHARGLELWRERWQVLEAHLVGEPYAMGATLSALDLYITKLGVWDFEPSWRAEVLPKVDAIIKLVLDNKPLEAVWRRHHPSHFRDLPTKL